MKPLYFSTLCFLLTDFLLKLLLSCLKIRQRGKKSPFIKRNFLQKIKNCLQRRNKIPRLSQIFLINISLILKNTVITKILPFALLIQFQAEGRLNVLTSTMNIKSVTERIGGDFINLESIVKGPQDPHFLAAKPSYMLKAKNADLLILAGMELEIGWLPNIIHGARNPRIQKGQKGYLDTSQFVQALSVPKGKVNRFFGDIHPSGNPHFFLDPLQAIQVSKGISKKLSELDPKNESHYIKNQEVFEKNTKKKMKEWEQRIQNSGIKKIVTYHNSFEYFTNRFQLNLIGLIEEKPGIPPSVKHLLNLIKKIRTNQVSCVLMSSFYSNKWAEKINKAVPIHIEIVAVEVMALKEAKNYILLIEKIVQAIENCGGFMKSKAKEKEKN